MKLIETPQEFAEWCDRRDYSKEEIARILGVTRQTLYNLTHPKSRAPAMTAALPETKEDLAKLSRLPPMLSLSLFAIDSLGTAFFGQSQRQRKIARRSK
jgi:DNA-binding XRE family transcriptional regulator